MYMDKDGMEDGTAVGGRRGIRRPVRFILARWRLTTRAHTYARTRLANTRFLSQVAHAFSSLFPSLLSNSNLALVCVTLPVEEKLPIE